MPVWFNTTVAPFLFTQAPRVLGQSPDGIGLYLTRRSSTVPIVRFHYQPRFLGTQIKGSNLQTPHKTKENYMSESVFGSRTMEPNNGPAGRETRLRTTTAAVEPFRGFDRPFARISWGAIFAGAIIVLATQLVLTLIGTAVGLATLNPATGQTPSGTTLGIGAGIWLVISSLVSLFLGGYIAGRLG